MNIGIIGAGWNGCHIARVLAKLGHKVTLLEEKPAPFSGTSGTFGIRAHWGGHYPRSEQTRRYCREGFTRLKATYKELLVDHEASIYGLGTLDADGQPSKVTNVQQFHTICQEAKELGQIHIMEEPEKQGYHNLLTAVDVEEPSIVLGQSLRKAFVHYLKEDNVNVIYNFKAQITSRNNGVMVQRKPSKTNKNNTRKKDEHFFFDKVINATGYQDQLPDLSTFPIDIRVTYQPCLALTYKDTKPGIKPKSFIVMDGAYPCLLPRQMGDDSSQQDYILTHGKWTIMGSYETPDEARTTLKHITDDFILQHIKPAAEGEMNRFYPEFQDRFTYTGWTGTVLAKMKTQGEFRCAVTFEKDNVIYIFPGKISNIFHVEDEVKMLLANEKVISSGHYRYIEGGVLCSSINEIQNHPNKQDRSTTNLQTYEELMASKSDSGCVETTVEQTIHCETPTTPCRVFAKPRPPERPTPEANHSPRFFHARPTKEKEKSSRHAHFQLQYWAHIIEDVTIFALAIIIAPLIISSPLALIAVVSLAVMLCAYCLMAHKPEAVRNDNKTAMAISMTA